MSVYIGDHILCQRWNLRSALLRWSHESIHVEQLQQVTVRGVLNPERSIIREIVLHGVSLNNAHGLGYALTESSLCRRDGQPK